MRSDRNIENDQIKKPEGHTCKKMQKEDLLLYAVTDRHWLNGETLYSQVEKTLEGGTTFVQLREKELDEAHFLEEAKKIKELCAGGSLVSGSGTNTLVINYNYHQNPTDNIGLGDLVVQADAVLAVTSVNITD